MGMIPRLFLVALAAAGLLSERKRTSHEMATYTFNGAVDTSWLTAGNWEGATGPPTANGHTVIISRFAQRALLADLNRSGDVAGAGLNVASFEVEQGYLYDIGTLAAPLRLTADVFTDRGDGALYFSSDSGTGALPTDRLIIDKGNIGQPVHVMGELVGASNAITEIEVTRGANVHFGHSSANFFTCTNLWLAPRQPGDVYVYGDSDLATVGTVHMAGGVFVVDGMTIGTEINMGGGELQFQGLAIPILNQYGGLVVHNGEAANYPITLYNAMNGFLVSTRTGGKKLISTLKRGPGWSMDYNPNLSVNGSYGGQGTFIGG